MDRLTLLLSWTFTARRSLDMLMMPVEMAVRAVKNACLIVKVTDCIILHTSILPVRQSLNITNPGTIEKGFMDLLII